MNDKTTKTLVVLFLLYLWAKSQTAKAAPAEEPYKGGIP